jgi:hypothetical protein
MLLRLLRLRLRLRRLRLRLMLLLLLQQQEQLVLSCVAGLGEVKELIAAKFKPSCVINVRYLLKWEISIMLF